MTISSDKIRNIAIIAHVDHGKTTLVDKMLSQAGTFRENQEVQDRVMDSNPLERERGITILAKNTSIFWKGHKINIVDTPGHADFGGEVERILSMIDTVVLLVDSSEGVMPQTKFVLGKALKLGLKVIVVVNKIDRPDRRVKEVLDEILDLFLHLNATDEQLDYPVFYGSGRDGWLSLSEDKKTDNLHALFDKIIEYVPIPKIIKDEHVRFLGTILGHDSFVGRLLTGKLESGIIKINQQLKVLNSNNEVIENFKVSRIQVSNGISRQNAEEAFPGDIITISGFSKGSVSDTFCHPNITEALKSIPIDPPTISIGISTNTSPLAGKDGTKLTLNLIRDRLIKESESNVSIKVEDSEESNFIKVSGRGELQLGILIENMRREGYELSVSRPKVIFKTINGVRCEPLEELVIDCPSEFANTVIREVSLRKAQMTSMHETGENQVRMIFTIPTRGLIGYRSEFLTSTRGTGVMNATFHSYTEYFGEINAMRNGVLASNGAGKATAFALDRLQIRGTMIINTGDDVYEGMIIGLNSKDNDLDVNVIEGKKLTNVRASGSDEAIKVIPPKIMTLEDFMNFIQNDELIEVTPNKIRIRKRHLKPGERKKYASED